MLRRLTLLSAAALLIALGCSKEENPTPAAGGDKRIRTDVPNGAAPADQAEQATTKVMFLVEKKVSDLKSRLARNPDASAEAKEAVAASEQCLADLKAIFDKLKRPVAGARSQSTETFIEARKKTTEQISKAELLLQK